MLFKFSLRVCLTALFIASFAARAETEPGTSVEDAFDEKFADDVRKVRRSRVTNDDAEFAQRLYKEAESGEHDPALTLFIYEKAYEFGIRDHRGFQAANDSLDKLLEKDASRKFDIGMLRLVLLEKWHEEKPDARGLDVEAFIDDGLVLSQEAIESGESDWVMKFLNRINRFASKTDSPRLNDIRDTITELVRTRKTFEELAKLEEAFAADPAVADQLAMIHLANLDDPAKATTYADQVTDAELAKMVRLAATDFQEATPEQASEIGAFYNSLVTDSKTRKPVAMLIRARVWLTEYLSRDQADADPAALAASVKETKELLGEIDAELLKRGIGRKLRRKMSSLLRGEGQFDRPAEIQACVDQAVEWLYTQRNDKTHWEKDQPNHRNYGGYTALVVYALLMADEDPRLNGDLSRSVHFLMNADLRGTYSVCFRIHAWEVLPRRERYRQRLMKDVTWMRAAATRHGFWGYTKDGRDVKPGSRLDLSTTLAGGLGIWIGEEAGGVTPKKVYWERTAKGLISVQHDDNGWSYNPAVNVQGQGAMTAAGLALLHASYPHLSDATKAEADIAIERGKKWMDDNFSPTTNVNRGGFKNYYFAAVQHAGIFGGRREFRDMDWYESIAEHLVKTQSPNGSMGSVEETAFAVAFLCRGGIVYEPFESENAEPEAGNDTQAASTADAPPGGPAE
ncbi:MAG: hypothetical protein AAF711_02675 [Planctomycetota bacterium]